MGPRRKLARGSRRRGQAGMDRGAEHRGSVQLSGPLPPRAGAAPQAKGRFKYERIGAPQPGEMARIAAERAIEMIEEVEESVVPFFRWAPA